VIVFFWAVFENYTRRPNTNLVCLFPRKKFCFEFEEKWVGPHFGQNFDKLIWSPCSYETLSPNLSSVVAPKVLGYVLTRLHFYIFEDQRNLILIWGQKKDFCCTCIKLSKKITKRKNNTYGLGMRKI
jgi:hypothetical protein